MSAVNVLIVEDRSEDAELLELALREEMDVAVTVTGDEASFLAALERQPDVILSDYSLPNLDAPRVLSILRERDLDIPCIVVTGAVGEEQVVACMRQGAADCLLKDRLARLGPAVRSALEARHQRAEKRAAEAALRDLTSRLERENRYLRSELGGDDDFSAIIGNSPRLHAVLDLLRKVAPTDVTLLIQGETGTGKELVARAVHSASPRADRPLVKVNCAALAPTLIESELFGHARGAFTGAGRALRGALRAGAHRNPVPRRGGRAAAGGAGQAPARLAGGRARARRRRAAGQGRRARGGRDQPRSARRGARRQLPRRSLLPAGGVSRRAAAASRFARRTCRCWRWSWPAA
jgi:DNA-binding NtrC family response regulator